MALFRNKTAHRQCETQYCLTFQGLIWEMSSFTSIALKGSGVSEREKVEASKINLAQVRLMRD